MTAIIRDLSKEAGLEREVRQSQRLAILGEMVATVSHEIRSPLALIGGFARQLERDPELSDKSLGKLGIITHEVERLERILNELGEFSRPHKYDWRETDPVVVLEHVVELMEPEINRAGAELKISRNGGLPPIMADADRLSQVLINLINNALQAGGEHPVIELVLQPTPEGVLLEVRDRGRGLESAKARELFTPFFTTKKGGTGLGLPVARRIVEEHGGRMELVNREDGGAVARVRLPTAPAIQQKLPLGEA